MVEEMVNVIDCDIFYDMFSSSYHPSQYYGVYCTWLLASTVRVMVSTLFWLPVLLVLLILVASRVFV